MKSAMPWMSSMRYAGLSTLRGCAAAAALIRGVGGDRDVALFRQALGIEAGGLFLHPAVRVGHDDRGICLLGSWLAGV